MFMSSLFAFILGTPEIVVLVIIGVLLFGRKLPDVGRYLGKSIVEFKKGVRGLEDDLDTGGGASPHTTAATGPSDQIRAPQRVAAAAPKFEESPTSFTANPPKA
jgi:sec-independent protein translocase protein TatA